MAYVTNTISAILYVIYHVQVNLHPDQVASHDMYKRADLLYFVAACFYMCAGMRDEGCFWFLPLAGQYGVSHGRIQVETKTLPQYGRPPTLVTDLCRSTTTTDIPYRNELTLSDQAMARTT
jgi:hypothetical protein